MPSGVTLPSTAQAEIKRLWWGHGRRATLSHRASTRSPGRIPVHTSDVPSGVIRLRLLGSLVLTDAEGVEVREVMAQPKRLGLLAYLAAAEPAGFRRRDVLLAFFWPEQDQRRARAALRRSLYLLRGALGPQVVVSRGDEVGVDASGVWCDAVAFREAHAGERWADALALYRGDLLPGFFVPSAPDFERWMEQERRRLRLMAAAGARELMHGAERVGDLENAVAWARRGVAIDPDDELATQHLIRLLDRHGDRTGALQTYEDFARRLRDEFGLEPAPDTQALAMRARSARGARASVASRQPEAPEPSPRIIAILPFTVHGAPDLGYLSEGLVDLLGAKLDGAGELRTVDLRTMLRAPAENEPEGVRWAARALGAGRVLLGSVTAMGRRLHIRAVLRGTDDDSEVRAEAAGEGEEALFGVVDELVRQLVANQTTSVGGQLTRLAARTTASLPALKAYLRGERAFRAGRFSEAVGAFQEATELDEAFPLSRYRLAAAHAATGRVAEARTATQAAHAGSHSLARHQRLLVEAQAIWLSGDTAAAEASYLQALDERPEDVEAWYHLGHLLFEFNPLRGRSAVEARSALQHTLALDPKHVGALGLLIRLTALEGDVARVGGLVERLLALSPTAEHALVVRAIRAWAGPEPGERNLVRADASTAAPRVLAALLREVPIAGREPAEVAELALDIARLPTAVALGALPYLVGAHLALRCGDERGAMDRLDAAARLEPREATLHRVLVTLRPGRSVEDDVAGALVNRLATDENGSDGGGLHGPVWPHVRAYLLGLAASVTDAPHAVLWAERCAALAPPELAPELPANLSAGVRAAAAWQSGEGESAIRHVALWRSGPGVWLAGLSPVFGGARERMLLAVAHEAQGAHAEADAWRAGIGQRSPFEAVLRVGPRG